MFNLANDARELTLWVGTGIQKAVAINHKMVWGRAEFENKNIFSLVSWKTETAIRAHSLLEKDLPLCSTDLGEAYSTKIGI